MSGDVTSLDPSKFTAAGETVAQALERAAIPAAPPVAMPGASPVDAAVANLAALMGQHITSASTELAPRGPAMRAASQAAVAEIQAQDELNAQQIKGVSSQKSAIDTVLGNMASGEGQAPKPAPDTVLGRLAAASPGSDVLGNIVAAPSPGSDVLGNMAAGGTARTSAGATLTDMGKKIAGSKSDWILGLGGAETGKFFDGVAELTRSGSPENKWVAKAVEEVKLFGSDVEGSRLGAAASSFFSLAAFAKDRQEGMPPVHAFIRESTAFVAGTVAGAPLDVTIVGAPAGMVVSAAASNATAFAIDTFYEMGKGVAEAGGPGAALKLARWGRPG